jgi:hypothetical protein
MDDSQMSEEENFAQQIHAENKQISKDSIDIT